ncbi:MAG: hypothetical protein IKL24_06035 [Clostridia bacterium]|nr:hypothetical protein [Clostridia bacterium]
MKRITALILAVLCIFALTACRKDASYDEKREFFDSIEGGGNDYPDADEVFVDPVYKLQDDNDIFTVVLTGIDENDIVTEMELSVSIFANNENDDEIDAAIYLLQNMLDAYESIDSEVYEEDGRVIVNMTVEDLDSEDQVANLEQLVNMMDFYNFYFDFSDGVLYLEDVNYALENMGYVEEDEFVYEEKELGDLEEPAELYQCYWCNGEFYEDELYYSMRFEDYLCEDCYNDYEN